MITRLSINEQGRDWIVGDIHGELVLLKQLLDDIQFDPGCDRLISVGDLIDRGPDSPGVLRLFDSSSWFHAVMGNHDALACLCMQHREFRYEHLWHSNGGDWYSRLRSETEAAALARIVSGLKACIEIPLADGRVIGVIHGEIAVGHTWNELQDYDPIEATRDWYYNCGNFAPLWGRDRAHIALQLDYAIRHEQGRLRDSGISDETLAAMFTPVTGIDMIVSGHTTIQLNEQAVPLMAGNCLFIDTGCGYDDGVLTAVDVLHQDIVQVGHGRARRGIVHAPGVFRSMDMAGCRCDGLGDGTKVKKRRVRLGSKLGS